MKKAKRFIVKGRVQGVGFRYFTNHVANALGIYGYVKNLYDGSVEVYAIGSDDQLEQLKVQITKGPSYSRVTHVTEEDCDFMDYFSFTVKY